MHLGRVRARQIAGLIAATGVAVVAVNGAATRHITVDDRLGEVWVPYRESARTARLQFRTQVDVDSLKRSAAGR
jgi:hypothetical protein